MVLVSLSSVVSEVTFGCLKSIRGTLNYFHLAVGDFEGYFVLSSMLVDCYSEEEKESV